MVNVFGVVVAIGLAALIPKFAQAQDMPPGEITIASDNAIAYIPPLAKAVLTGDPTRVSEALKEGAEANDQVRATKGNRAGFTPLILAAALSEPKIVDMLIARGAKISLLDDYNRSALWYAAFHGDAEVTEALTNASTVGDIVNIADSDFKRTPLHLAVRGNDPRIVSVLLKFGASKSETQKDILNETPIEYCQHTPTGACKELPSK